MKDYHSILELPTNASDEQIRVQYKRLVRVYHPDRFTNPHDKGYVEEKLREINEAYQILLSRSNDKSTRQIDVNHDTVSGNSELLPHPVAQPALLDFGELPRGERKALIFQLHNTGGTVEKYQLDFSENSGWFKVANGRRLHKQRPFPMEFAVVVDTNRLNTNQDYRGWIQITMNSETVHIPVSVKVAAPKLLTLLSPRIAVSLSILALMAMVFAVQFFDLVLPIFSQSPVPVLTAELNVTTQQPAVDPVDKGGPSAIDSGVPNLAKHEPHAAVQPPIEMAIEKITSTIASVVVGRSGLSNNDSPATLPRPEEYLEQLSELSRKKSSASVTATAITHSSVPTLTVVSQPVVAASTTPITVTPSGSSLVQAATPVVTGTEETEMITHISSTTAVRGLGILDEPATFTPIPTALPVDMRVQQSTAIPSHISTVPPAQTATPGIIHTATQRSIYTVTPTETPIPTPSTTFTRTRTPTRAPTRTPIPKPTVTNTITVAITAQTTAAATSESESVVESTITSSPPTPTAIAGRATVIIPDRYNVNARADVSTNAEIVQVLVSGTQWLAVGRTFDNTWLYIQVDNERFAWVFTETVTIDSEEMAHLPVIVPKSFQ